MATAGQQTPPSTSERIDLSLNGIGEKKLSFPNEGNSAEVHETILAAFLALEEGHEILRAGEERSKQLLLIPMPLNGFSVSYLQSVLGQAKGYLRPLQRDIVIETRQGGIASPDKVFQLSSPTGISPKARRELSYKRTMVTVRLWDSSHSDAVCYLVWSSSKPHQHYMRGLIFLLL